MEATDTQFMAEALAEAHQAFAEDEVPVGAVVVCEGRVIGRGRNAKEHMHDPTAHAEMLAIRQAAQHLARWRLEGCTLYTSLEPCPMCVGAALMARLPRLVYAASDPKSGAAESLYHLGDDPRLNHRIDIQGGILASEAAALLKDFFAKKRKRVPDL